MTELAAEIPAAADKVEEAKGTAPAINGSQPEARASDPFSALSEDKREWVGTKGFQNMDALVASYQEVEKWKGRAIPLPGDDAKPEEWDRVWEKLGRPPSADGYELAPPEGMPADLPYDQDTANWFKETAHKANATKQQAKVFHDAWVTMAIERATKDAQARVDKANADLVSAWGAKDTDAYKENLKLADRGIQTLGGDALMSSLKGAGLLGPGGEILDATIAVAFAKAGKSLGSEGQFVSGVNVGENNPYLPGKENITEQMKLWRTDPSKARMLMAAAGKRPADYGIRE